MLRRLSPGITQTAVLSVAVLAGVFVCAVAWEFGIEGDLVEGRYEAQVETTTDKWEYALTSTAFAALALILPALLLHQSLRRREQSEISLKDFAELSSDWLWETDSDHRFRFVAGHPVGPAEEMIGKRCDELDGADADSRSLDQLAEHMKERRPFRDFVYPRRRRDGSTAWISVSGKPLFGPRGRFLGYRGVGVDVTAAMTERQKLHSHASTDPLTNVANRRLFHEKLQMLRNLVRLSGGSFAVMFLDLDDFKVVNDTRGHAVGDQVLEEVGVRLRRALRRSDTVARLGGDEFAVLLPEIKDGETAKSFGDKFIALINEPIGLATGGELRVGASIGIAMYPADGEDALSLVEAADRAMYEAKRKGKGRIEFVARAAA